MAIALDTYFSKDKYTEKFEETAKKDDEVKDKQ